MRSMYAAYVEELSHGQVLETDQGFAVYVFPDADSCYLKEIYVRPEFRKKGAGLAISATIETIAKQRGCKYLLGSVVPSAKGSTRSLRLMLANGYELCSASADFILFKKGL